MQQILSDLRRSIIARVDQAPPRELLEFVGHLCDAELATATPSLVVTAQLDETPRGALAVAKFEVLDEDVVLDHNTGLYWLRDYVPGGSRNWQDSIDAAAAVTVRGWKWRAPTRAERLSIVDDTRHSPALHPDVFRGDPDGWEWTSTPYAPSPRDCAWDVGSGYGNSYGARRDYSGLVRAVRAGQ